MPIEKVFRIQVYAKRQLAELYHVSLKTLMKWIEPLRKSHPDVFPPKEKDRSHLFTPKQVKLIVELLDAP